MSKGNFVNCEAKSKFKRLSWLKKEELVHMRERGKKREKREERKEKEEKTFRAKVEKGEM